MVNKYFIRMIAILICAINCSAVFSQSSVPTPLYHFAFDNPQNLAYESIHGTSAQLSGACVSTTDRYGNSGRAVYFFTTGSGIRLANPSVPTFNTVSFWTYISDPSSIPEGPVPYSETQPHINFYNWIDNANNILRGTARRSATVGFNRYIEKDNGDRVPWYLWSYEPAQFDEIGWYHVFVVQGEYYTRLVMYKPGGTKAYSFNYLGAQDFSTMEALAIGGFGINKGPYTPFDDLKVYGVELSDEQIDVAHTKEYPLNRYIKLKNSYSSLDAMVYGASMQNLSRIYQSVNGIGNDEWILRSTGTLNEFRLENLHSRKIMVVEDALTTPNANIVQYTNNGTPNEVWILENMADNPLEYKLKNKNSGLYLSLRTKTTGYSELTQYPDGDYANRWSFVLAGPAESNNQITPGLYTIRNKKSGLLLDLKNTIYDVGAYLTQDEFSYTKHATIWNIAPGYSNGYYIQNMVNDLYVSVLSTGWDYLRMQNATSSNQDTWQFLPTGRTGEYRLRNAHSYQYAAVNNASTEAGEYIVQQSDGSGDECIWRITPYFYDDSPIQSGIYEIRNLNSNKKMVVKDASRADGANLIQYSTGEDNAKFEVDKRKYGTISLRNLNSDKFVVVKNASSSEYADIVQWGSDFPGNHALWRPYRSYTPGGSGIELVNLRSGLKIAVENASHMDGAKIIQNSTAVENGTWNFYVVPEPRNISVTSNIESSIQPPQVKLINSKLYVYSEEPSSTSIQCYISSIDGMKVFQDELKSEDGLQHCFDLSDANLLSHHIYIVRISSEEGKLLQQTKIMIP